MNTEVKIYKVSELNRIVNILLEDRFPEIWVEGEVSNCKIHTSGHLYFTLKDELAQIDAIMYSSYVNLLRFNIENGMHIIVKGRISLFIKGGRYQIVAYYIEPKGKGALQVAFEQLKKKLQKEGLFDEKYKKPIPLLPQRIGVVTSPTGAAIRDILTVIKRRFANVRILVYPVRVQGEGACDEIASGIDTLNKLFPELDVIIVGRGGGSLEDLWAFNEEVVARAIFSSDIPIISAVGHEIDYTIADLVSDLRAPTPSAAAELVVENKMELKKRITLLYEQIKSKFLYNFKDCINRINEIKSKRVFIQPSFLYLQKEQALDYLGSRMLTGFTHSLEMFDKSLNSLISRLNTLSPLNVLARGYSIVWKEPEKKVIKSYSQLNKNDKVKIKFYKGNAFCKVENTQKD